MVQWAQGTRWHSSMTGEGTISFYSLEIKQTGDGGSAQGLTSYGGQYDDEANQAALGCGDPALAFTNQLFKAIENILIEVHLFVLNWGSSLYLHFCLNAINIFFFLKAYKHIWTPFQEKEMNPAAPVKFTNNNL